MVYYSLRVQQLPPGKFWSPRKQRRNIKEFFYHRAPETAHVSKHKEIYK